MASQHNELTPYSSESKSEFTKWTGWRTALWIIMPACWFIQAASYRHAPNADGINYLDMAEACAKGNWGALVNGYWSPLYPFLVSLWLRLTRPSPYREVVTVQYLNCLLLALTFFLFEYFLYSLQEFLKDASKARAGEKPLPFGLVTAIGYLLFFWMSLYLLPPNLITPDILVWASLMLTGACLLRIGNGKGGWFIYIALGFSLGAGYLAKAFMFPMMFVMLGFSVVYLRSLRRVIPGLLLSAVVALLVAGPAVYSLSREKGRFTFSDVGAINYAEYVNGVLYFSHWQGGPPGTGTPKHPVRKLADSPPVYEYASPVGGTHPVGYDLSYWYDGVRPHFEWRGQLNALRKCFDTYFEIFTELGAVVAGFFVLFFAMQSIAAFPRNFFAMGFLWGPCVAALLLYSLVHVEGRFLPGFLMLICLSLFAALRLPDGESTRKLARSTVFAIALVLGTQIAWALGHSAVRLALSGPYPGWTVAEALQQSGVAPGEHIAFIGPAQSEAVWAHLAGVTFVAEVPEEGTLGFLLASPDVKLHVLDLFRQAGAKAVMTRSLPPETLSGGWKKLGDTDYHILLLNPNGVGSGY